jgi:hypothetical protein
MYGPAVSDVVRARNAFHRACVDLAEAVRAGNRAGSWEAPWQLLRAHDWLVRVGAPLSLRDRRMTQRWRFYALTVIRGQIPASLRKRARRLANLRSRTNPTAPHPHGAAQANPAPT